ncbi:MAG: hypothetical protein K6E10_10865 [Eubacterium sp.]|nr:hypothetical protein [Eubacterium sp.]
MKKFLVLVTSLIMVFSLSACGKEEEATTEAVTEESSTGVTAPEEIVQLVNVDLPAIAADRDSAVAIYNKYYEDGADIDSETWKEELKTTAIPAYETYLTNLKALSYSNGEVQNLLDIYVKSAEYQKDAMDTVVSAIEEVDTDKLDEANSMITDSKTYMGMYEDELTRLCQSYGISMIGDFGTATDASATDAE